MRRLVRAVAMSVVMMLVISAIQPVTGASRLRDISGNWAVDHIMSLMDKGIVGGYPDGTFRPNRTVTRAEFAKMAVKAFGISAGKKLPYRDTKKHWAASEIASLHTAKLIKGYEDGGFRPNRTISRAEVTAVVVRALKLDAAVLNAKPETTSFSDIGVDHWAAGVITAAEQLGILPPYFNGRFRPADPATRAEAAALLNGALRLQVVDGVADYVDSVDAMVSVKSKDGSLRDFALSPSAQTYRNSSLAEATTIRKGDKVRVVADRFGTPIYVMAQGKASTEEVVNKVSSITKGLLTPEQLKSAIKGDWASVAGGFQVTLYNQLLDVGATPAEADSIMQKDWSTLGLHGRDRLGQAFGKYLGVSNELATALLDQNWAEARQLAEVEATQALLGRLLFGSAAS